MVRKIDNRDDRRAIVIGSGPSGAMAARELVQRGIPVVMLESGIQPSHGLLVRAAGRNLYRWNSMKGVENGAKHISTGDPNAAWWTNHSAGGLSNQWTGAVPRFAPEDFHEGERLHERYRWPLDYEDLVPYYERVERLLCITAGIESVPNLPNGFASYHRKLAEDWAGIAKSALRHGQGLTTAPLADGPPWMLVRRGAAFNSFYALVRPLLASPNFQFVTGAHALRLERSEAKGRVSGVVYRRRIDGAETRIAGSAVILACGPLDSTRVLFNSACSDFPCGLGNSEGILGKYLHDHPREWWVFDIDSPVSVPAPSLFLTRPPHGESKPLYGASWTIGAATAGDKVRGMLGLKARRASVQIFGTMIPTEEHYVTPDSSRKDSFGMPLLRIHIRFGEEAVCNVVESRSRLFGILEDAGYNCRIRDSPPPLRPGTAVHYGGTARMHADSRFGVVDGWNRVYDCPNVLVVDASCFTTGSEKNPTLTAMALSSRAAERLAANLKAGLHNEL